MANVTVVQQYTSGWGNVRIYAVTPGAPYTLQIDANPNFNETVIVKDVAGLSTTYNITVTASPNTIDKGSSIILNSNYESLTLVYDGVSNWMVV